MIEKNYKYEIIRILTVNIYDVINENVKHYEIPCKDYSAYIVQDMLDGYIRDDISNYIYIDTYRIPDNEVKDTIINPDTILEAIMLVTWHYGQVLVDINRLYNDINIYGENERKEEKC